MIGKRRNSTIDQKWEDSYLYNGQLSTSRCIKTVIIFQQHFVFNIKIKGSVKLFQKIGVIIRSSNNSKWQACMREKTMLTDHDKQATENREPADEMNKEDPTQGLPVWLQPFTVHL